MKPERATLSRARQLTRLPHVGVDRGRAHVPGHCIGPAHAPGAPGFRCTLVAEALDEGTQCRVVCLCGAQSRAHAAGDTRFARTSHPPDPPIRSRRGLGGSQVPARAAGGEACARLGRIRRGCRGQHRGRCKACGGTRAGSVCAARACASNPACQVGGCTTVSALLSCARTVRVSGRAGGAHDDVVVGAMHAEDGARRFLDALVVGERVAKRVHADGRAATAHRATAWYRPQRGARRVAVRAACGEAAREWRAPSGGGIMTRKPESMGECKTKPQHARWVLSHKAAAEPTLWP